MLWEGVQDRIESCRRCEDDSVKYLRVPPSLKRHPSYSPPVPTRIYFVSVAPPWGGAYFWDKTKRDGVREGLFKALRSVLEVPLIHCQNFHDLGFHLSPAVKCPSEKAGKDHQPSKNAIRNCAVHLRSELESAQPERILALGRVPFQTLIDIFGLDAPEHVDSFHGKLWWVRVGNREIPISGTYFPGNDRHQGFHYIAQDIVRLLSVSTR